MEIEILDHMTIEATVRFGKPVIRGTRVPVSVVVGQAAAGLTHEAIAEEYGIEVEDVRAVLTNRPNRGLSPVWPCFPGKICVRRGPTSRTRWRGLRGAR